MPSFQKNGLPPGFSDESRRAGGIQASNFRSFARGLPSAGAPSAVLPCLLWEPLSSWSAHYRCRFGGTLGCPRSAPAWPPQAMNMVPNLPHPACPNPALTSPALSILAAGARPLKPGEARHPPQGRHPVAIAQVPKECAPVHRLVERWPLPQD